MTAAKNALRTPRNLGALCEKPSSIEFNTYSTLPKNALDQI